MERKSKFERNSFPSLSLPLLFLFVNHITIMEQQLINSAIAGEIDKVEALLRNNPDLDVYWKDGHSWTAYIGLPTRATQMLSNSFWHILRLI